MCVCVCAGGGGGGVDYNIGEFSIDLFICSIDNIIFSKHLHVDLSKESQ